LPEAQRTPPWSGVRQSASAARIGTDQLNRSESWEWMEGDIPSAAAETI
jgi:hypothetical protein